MALDKLFTNTVLLLLFIATELDRWYREHPDPASVTQLAVSFKTLDAKMAALAPDNEVLPLVKVMRKCLIELALRK